MEVEADMANDETKPEPKPEDAPAVDSPGADMHKVRQTQLYVLVGSIVLDVGLLLLSGYLLWKHGVKLEMEKLLITATIFAALSGLGPAVALSVLWPRGGEHHFAGMRRTQYGYNVVFGCRLLFGMLAIGNVIIAQYGPPHFDWTSDKVFTLNSASVNLVKSLEKPVKFVALYPRGSQPGRQLETLFDLYENETDNVTHDFVDRFEDKIRSEEVFKQFPDAKQADPVVIITYGAGEKPDYRVVKHSEIFPPATASGFDMREVETEFKGEDALTSGIAQLTKAQKTNVYFTTGHGELSIEKSDARADDGIGIIKERMEGQGITVGEIDLAQKEVPKDANVLVIAGPKTPLFPEEVQKVKDFLSGGGRLVAMFDTGTEMRGSAQTGLESLLGEYNVAVKDNLAIDQASNFRHPARLLVLPGATRTSHSIIDDLKEERILMELAREVSAKTPEPPPGMPGQPPPPSGPYKADSLLSTVPGTLPFTNEPISWAEGNYKERNVEPGGEEDTAGPVSLAVAVSRNDGSAPDPHMGMPGAPPPRQNTTPLLVVFGDASFASNHWVNQLPTNSDLFLNSVNWLRGRLELIGIQPKTKKSLRLTLDDRKYYRMIFMPTGIMLAGLIGLAGGVWVIRHRF